MNTDALVRDLGPDYYKAANFLNAIQWVKQATSISYVELFETAKRQQEHDAWFFEESEVNAETAKANEYLKSFSKALQDEFDEYFVDPMLRRLQARLSDKGLGVGVIQRDRLLTTNRRVARIDPKASAELSIGQTEDVLADIGQIAELLGILEPLAGGGLEPSEKLSQLAQGLQDSAREDDPAEIYGFSSGNTFKVTTIHEPGGQGLRFNLDYNHASVITDPDGSTGARDPRLPRFERNTINTEVQLDNLEFRLVASHETNAAFGKAEKKIGGIPFIKDDPIIRDLPLLGYFKRSRGQAALRQHHLIFAQATIYPTISEVMSLMTTPIPYDGRHLDHLYETSEREKQQQDLLAKAKLAEKLKEQNKQYQEDLSRLLEDLTQDKDDSESESDVWLVNWDGDALEGEVLRRECVCQPGSACSCAVPGKLYSFGIRLIENASMHEFVRMPSFGYRQLSRDAAGKAFADDEARLAYWLCVLECRPCPGRDCSCSLQGLAVANPDSLPPGNMVPGCSANLKDLQNGNQAFRVRLVSREEK